MEVRELRLQTGLSQSKFAKMFDVPVSTLKDWELLPTLSGQLLKHVTLKWRSIDDIILRLGCIPHREAIVVACGKAYILSTRSLHCRHPLLSIEAVWIEGIGSLSILIAVKTSILQVPLALGKHTVYAPVNEDTKAILGELLAHS